MEEQRSKKGQEHVENRNMTKINTIISVIILNVNDLNIPVKRQRLLYD